MPLVPPEVRQLVGDDAELPGVAYFSPANNEGEVRLFVVLQKNPRKVIRVTIPADLMPDDLPQRVERMAAEIVNEKGVRWGPRLVG